MKTPKGPEAFGKNSLRTAILSLMAAMSPVKSMAPEMRGDQMLAEDRIKGEKMWAEDEGPTQALADELLPVTVEADLEQLTERTTKNRHALEDLLGEK